MRQIGEFPDDMASIRTACGINGAVRQLRVDRRETQQRFWSRFGVSQTRGSRFELGQRIPPTVAILLRLYVEGVVDDGDLWRARRRRGLAAPR